MCQPALETPVTPTVCVADTCVPGVSLRLPRIVHLRRSIPRILAATYTLYYQRLTRGLFFFDYRKGVSFLSRIIGTKKKDQPSEAEDETSESEAHRMSVDTSHPIGFIPRHPAPSKYLKVRAHYKKDKTFNRVFLAQELQGSGPSPKPADRRVSTSSTSRQNGDHTGKAVWALMFSKDGKYLAAAGQDRKVRVWTVIATPEEREDANGDEEATPVDAQDTSGLKAPVFQPVPVQVYEGHTGSILDLSWSKVCMLKAFNSMGNGRADL
jgi:WD40 repeat protein